VRLRRTSLIIVLLCLVLLVTTLDNHASCETPSSELIDLMREENADTISFKEKVAFMSPSGEEVSTPLGIYRVQSVGPSALRLVPFEKNDAFVIKAQPTRHHEDISFPIALLAVDDEYLVHVVLLLPERKGLEAVGSSSRGRHRGSPELLTPEQIHEALNGQKAGRP
jgi:hypothetical protein